MLIGELCKLCEVVGGWTRDHLASHSFVHNWLLVLYNYTADVCK